MDADRNIIINADVDLGGAISLEGQDIVLNNNIISGSGSSSIIGKLSGSGNFAQTNGGLTINATGDSTYNGVISGGGSLIKTGTGKLTLTGTNTYSGSTTISDGTLQLGNNTATGSINNSSIINNSALVLDFSDDMTLSSDISGTGTLYVTARYFDLYDSTSSSSLDHLVMDSNSY